MASVRKRAWTHKGVEKEAWVVAYTDQGGKRRLKTFDKKKDADRYRTKVETEIEQGTHVADAETVTLADAMEEWNREQDRRHQHGDITATTLKGYIGKGYHARTSPIGRKKVAQLTHEDLREFFDTARGTLAAGSLHAVHHAIFATLQMCIRKRWVRRNVLRDEPVSLPIRTKRLAVPTRKEIGKLLNAIEDRSPAESMLGYVNRRAIICLGLFQGLRPGEMVALRWEDIDWETGWIRIARAWSRLDGVKAPKTNAGVRSVPLTEPTRDALNLLASHQMARERAFAGSRDKSFRHTLTKRYLASDDSVDVDQMTGLILRNRLGDIVRADTLHREWLPVMRKAGLCDDNDEPLFTLYALRHAAASLFIAGGMPAMNLTSVMGHTRVSFTYDTYGHLFPEDDRTKSIAAEIAAAFPATTARHESVTL